MTIFTPLTTDQKQQLTAFLVSDAVPEGCLDFIAMHGFLTGIATGPESLVESECLSMLFDGQPQFQNIDQKKSIEALIEQQAKVIQRSLYLGEDLELPCQLVASAPGETNSLSDWCFGFIEAMAISEDDWFEDADSIETIAELLLPAGLLSEQFSDPEVEHLTADSNARQLLADDLIENIQNLYLFYRE